MQKRPWNQTVLYVSAVLAVVATIALGISGSWIAILTVIMAVAFTVTARTMPRRPTK